MCGSSGDVRIYFVDDVLFLFLYLKIYLEELCKEISNILYVFPMTSYHSLYQESNLI